MPHRARWRKCLQQAGHNFGGVKLPADVSFTGEGDTVTLGLNASAVTGNMQADKSAFEAWSLALRVWCKAAHVRLIWEQPILPAEPDSPEQGHYERFLYRVGRFAQLFPEWFIVAQPARLVVSRVLDKKNLVVNAAQPRRTSTRPAQDSEARAEWDLLNSGSLQRAFSLAVVDRQFPVGLFAGHVSKADAIFTGGKSAIDLVGIKDGIFHIFELKIAKNRKLGIISELLFYASFIRDTLVGQKAFSFENKKIARGVTISGKDAKACQGIEAVFLVEKFHPLVGAPEIIAALNEAAAKNWNSAASNVPVHFSARFVVKDAAGQYSVGSALP